MRSIPAPFTWVIPYTTRTIAVNRPPEKVIEHCLSLNAIGLAIHNPNHSRFNQGRYQVIANGRDVRIRGPRRASYRGDSSFPIETRLTIHPMGNRPHSRLVLRCRPTIRAVAPLCLVFLAPVSLVVWVSIASQSSAVLSSAIAFGGYVYAMMLLFFYIEVGILVRSLHAELHS